MKQKAVIKASAFTMFRGMGITGGERKPLHQHPAYRERAAMLMQQTIPAGSRQLLLPGPS